MGLVADVANGKLDYVHGDVENLADPRTWPFPKKQEAKNPKDEELKEQCDEEAQTISSDSESSEEK